MTSNGAQRALPTSSVAGSSAEPETQTSVAGKHADDRNFVTALARGLDLLACFRTGETSLSNLELAQRCGLPKSTVSRLTRTLTLLGYLIQVPDTGKYRLGTACLALGSAMLTRLDVREVAWPLMHELAQKTGLSVSLLVRDHLSMIYLEHCRSAQTLSFRMDAGSRIPLVSTAAGRAWLAASAPRERASVLGELQVATRAGWPQVQRSIDEAVEEYATSGIARSFGDWNKRVNAVARAFRPGKGLPLMCLNLGGTSEVSPEYLMDEGRSSLIHLTNVLEEALIGSTLGSRR